MAVSHLFLYVELTPVVTTVCCMSFVWGLVYVMCGMKSVSCAGFSLCHERDLALFMCRLCLCYVRDLVCLMCGL